LNGSRRVLIANDKDVENEPDYTWLPGDADAPSPYPNLAAAVMVVTNQARLALSTNVSVADLYVHDNGITNVFLNGYTLYVDSHYHAHWGNSNWVMYSGGQILWKPPRAGTMVIIR
jgi:hypothetical protein